MNEEIGKIAKKFIEEKNGDAKALASIAPFMDEEALEHVAAEYLKREGNVSSLTALAPFFESSFLKELLFKRQK